MSAKEKMVLIPNFLDFAPTWNRGVSFSLFSQGENSGRYVLIAILCAIVIGVGTLAWRAGNSLTAMGYGFVVGGALGNLLDRGRYGAVFDYLFLHLGREPLFIFNFPDAVITMGVALLIADSLRAEKAGSALSTE
ncbi:MAG: signal peptidase II [Rhizomicrobium sp.]